MALMRPARGEEERSRGAEGGLEKPLRESEQTELHSPPGSPLPEPQRGFLRGRSCQHHPACPTCVIEVPGPLVVVGLLREHGFRDEFLRLVVEVVVEIIPQQQVEERGLPVGVVAQRGRPQPGVKEAAAQGRERILGREGEEETQGEPTGPALPPDHVEFIQELVDTRVVVVTLGHHQVQGPAVLGTDLLHQVVRHLLSLQEGNGADEMLKTLKAVPKQS